MKSQGVNFGKKVEAMATLRGRSMPVSLAPNPFWSTRARGEHVLQRLRPEDLPVVPATPEGEDLHSLDGLGPSPGQQAAEERSAEMRSARSRSSERGGRGRATPIPRSWLKDLYKVTFERDAEHFKAKTEDMVRRSQSSREVGKQTSGPMPVEEKREKSEDAPRGRDRGKRLEEELGKQLVQDLLEQNQRLQAELQRLTTKLEGGAAEGSSSTWSKVSEEDTKVEEAPKTPREGTSGCGARFTPHGTRVPDEMPEGEMPKPPPPEWRGGFYPPPTGWTLGHYEVEEMKRPGHAGDWVWIPGQEKTEKRRQE